MHGAPRLADGLELDVGGLDPFAGGVAVGLVHDHALREQTVERLVEADETHALHGAGEEARVEQMQNRVLDAADVLVHRQPGIDRGAIGRRGLDPRIGEAGKIPGRIHKSVHGVGLAPRRLSALRASHVFPSGMAV